jgi:hypothetical protein
MASFFKVISAFLLLYYRWSVWQAGRNIVSEQRPGITLYAQRFLFFATFMP